MKITAGLGSIDEYIRFAEAGADEFFSGYVPYSWAEKYGTVMPLNRREVFCYNVARFVGAYAASLNGVDVIAFTAGIGENSGFVRGKICEYLGYLGITIDAEQNSKRGEDIIISTPDSKVTVCVIPTNEELMIARDTKALVEAQ